jgi:hypothetical protein
MLHYFSWLDGTDLSFQSDGSEGKGHSIHVCGGTEVRGMYISNPLATSAPEGVDGEYQVSAAFPQERNSTHHTERSKLVCIDAESTLPTWFRTPKRPTRSELLKPTTLYRPPVRRMITQKIGWIFCIIFAICFEVSNFFELVELRHYVVRAATVRALELSVS